MPRFSMRRRISVLAFAIAASGAYFSAQAENFPDHPIRLVVAYAPGAQGSARERPRGMRRAKKKTAGPEGPAVFAVGARGGLS